MKEHSVLLGLGSNIEPRIQRINEAIGVITGHLLSDAIVSSFYETEPVGYTEQASFINAAVCGFTSAEPHTIFQHVKNLERSLGRQQREQWHEREIDVDIILFGTVHIEGANLWIPHPRFRDRAFVLVPAAEVAPNMADPVTGRTIAELLAACTDGALVTKLPAR